MNDSPRRSTMNVFRLRTHEMRNARIRARGLMRVPFLLAFSSRRRAAARALSRVRRRTRIAVEVRGGGTVAASLPHACASVSSARRAQDPQHDPPSKELQTFEAQELTMA
jgi:hypothetical protein